MTEFHTLQQTAYLYYGILLRKVHIYGYKNRARIVKKIIKQRNASIPADTNPRQEAIEIDHVISIHNSIKRVYPFIIDNHFFLSHLSRSLFHRTLIEHTALG